MDTIDHKIWQVAAGDADRNYAELCLEWDVILNGPGEEGPWPECRDVLANDWKLSSRKLADIKRFAETISDGDIIILRLGKSAVYGVGVVVGNYEHNEEFGDIDGWGLEHIRRVRWIWKCPVINGKPQPKTFTTSALKWGDTTQEVTSDEVKKWIEDDITVTNQDLNRPIIELPKPSQEIPIDKISEYLFDKGIAAGAIAAVTGEIDELIRIAQWYQRNAIRPSETETIAYLVIPLLRVLGWTPQKMAVEWNNVDVALFKTLKREDVNLSVVVEAKAKDWSCLSAKSQAQIYAEQSGRETCNRLIVTDGIRYGLYSRDKDNKFKKHPDAYLNITRLREAYPLLHCRGAQDAFLYMSADWNVLPQPQPDNKVVGP